MSRFDECLAFVLKREGGYVNHPNDKGGATNKGVTQAVYDDYRTRLGKGRLPVSGISSDEVRDIYFIRYWQPSKAGSLPLGMDLCQFDASVNHGIRQAALFLQRALGVDDDGVVGPKTITAAMADEQAGMVHNVVACMIDERRDFYWMLVERDPTQEVFIDGWLNRLKDLAKECY